jgi:AcrR family transcriptional regulator
VATEVGVAKGTVFLDFGSKETLFLEAFKRAVSLLPAWLDAPADIVEQGFWAVLDWWLQRAEELVASDPVPNRVALIARTDTGLDIRRPVDRFMRSEDPYGTLEFVEFGVKRGELRDDVDAEMIASTLDWMAERFQDALVSEDLDPGLIHRRPERRPMRIKEFVEVLRGGIAPPPE